MARTPMYLQPAKDYLAEHGETKATALADALSISPATLLSGIRTAIAQGAILKRQDGRAVFYRLPEQEAGGPQAPYHSPQPEPVDLGDFNAALWADGDLVLVGVELNTDGKSVTLNARQTAAVRRLLGGA